MRDVLAFDDALYGEASLELKVAFRHMDDDDDDAAYAHDMYDDSLALEDGFLDRNSI